MSFHGCVLLLDDDLGLWSSPYFEDDMTSDSPDLMRGQKSFEWMIDWLDNQFLELSKVLPDSWSTLYGGRATKLAALALRAAYCYLQQVR